MIPEQKKQIVKRAAEIIRDYLYDEDETYAYITMYFEKENGENQAKRLVFGTPSKKTPDLARDYPEGYIDIKEPFGAITLDEILTRRVVWVDFNNKEWDGLTVSQKRMKMKEAK